MKTKTFAKLNVVLLAITIALFSTSCKKKYAKYDNMEVVENTYTGNVLITSTGSDPGADFTGVGNSGKYSFVWDNPKKRAELNYDITTPSGSVQFIINDAKGKEVLNVTRSAGGDDTFSGVSDEGKKGKWLITIIFTNFDGDGSFSISPID
ncbi:MAG TPA: hypothetical protein DIU39_08200 [Flavobacteriales bacterium]|nr:hypothetical protein [Flavobacteriales bacterium]|tara:strand:- start:37434 stop:37886 length:453 start_codon:yes stop_codon:yes gene_type:complete